MNNKINDKYYLKYKVSCYKITNHGKVEHSVSLPGLEYFQVPNSLFQLKTFLANIARWLKKVCSTSLGIDASSIER